MEGELGEEYMDSAGWHGRQGSMPGPGSARAWGRGGGRAPKWRHESGAGAGTGGRERERYRGKRPGIGAERGARDGEVDAEQNNMESLLDGDFFFFFCYLNQILLASWRYPKKTVR